MGNPDPSSDPRPEFLLVGRVIRPHGVRGDLVVEPSSDVLGSLSPESRVYLGPDHAPVQILAFRPHKRRYLVTLEGCATAESAEALRGHELFIRLADAPPLPEGVYYHWQVIGLEVFSDEQEHLGKVEDILHTGANDVYVVRDRQGGELLLPAIRSVILEVNLAEGTMTVHLLPGLRAGE